MKTLGECPAGKLQAVIELPQSPDDGEKVLRLVNRLGVCREDDTPEEAVNRLASMALVLSNIAAGHLRGRADGAECELGVNFIIEGGFAAAEFVSSVVGPVSWIQDRWERNLLHAVAPAAPLRGRLDPLSQEKMNQDNFDGLLLPAFRAGRMFLQSQREYFEANSGGSDGKNTAGQQTRDTLMPVDMVSPPLTAWRRPTLCREAMNYPVVFSEAVMPAALQGRAARSHLGRLLVHSRIDSADSLEKLRRTLAEAMERGTCGRADGSPPVRADLALCGAAGLLDEAVAADTQPLVSGLLWLVESSSGCDLPGSMDGMPDSSAPDFRGICEREIRRRINFTDEAVHKLDALNGRMTGWRSFLRECERHLPGIAATAGNLPAALCYGLQAICSRPSEVDGDEVLALAKWLVLRMFNRISVAAAGERGSGTERLAEKLAEKLATDGPMKVRELMRKCSRLTAGDCRKGLALLANNGIAAEQDGLWGILGEFQIVRASSASAGN